MGDAESDETLRVMRDRGLDVVVLDPASSPAARVELVPRFRAEKPGQWLEDWGGSSNPALPPRQ